MTHKIGIYYDENGLRDILKGNEISQMEQQIMMERISRVQSEFLQRFGFNGKFEIKRIDTNSRRSRTTFRIVASDAKTTAVLKREPGWLDKFIH